MSALLAELSEELSRVEGQAAPTWQALVEPIEHLTTIKHGVTRYRITLDCHAARYISGRTKSTDNTPLRWVKPAELDTYPLSTTGRKIGQMVAGLKNGV